MREIRSSGSAEGVMSNHDPYSDFSELNGLVLDFCEIRRLSGFIEHRNCRTLWLISG